MKRLRQQLLQPGIIKCAGAHDAASAKIAQCVGFDAIWASSFGISVANCVPDESVLSMKDFLDVTRSISTAVSIPVIADCDTGYGNEANVAYAVQRFEAAGASGICIEDQKSPKSCSLFANGQKLAPVREFTAKIRAAKRAQKSPDFVLIARTEALITGAGLGIAEFRAREYAQAGADAVLIHWNQASPQPIIDFLGRWTLKTPVVVIPTTYGSITAQKLEELNAKMVIYANQGIRCALQAIEDAFTSILQDGTADNVKAMWPLSRALELQQLPNADCSPTRPSRPPVASADTEWNEKIGVPN
jgi:phosphoenolpyruvate phosphomutase